MSLEYIIEEQPSGDTVCPNLSICIRILLTTCTSYCRRCSKALEQNETRMLSMLR